MSGIYINMEMPDRCFACPLFLFDEGEGFCRKTIYGGSALEYRKVDIEIAIDTRPNWCPLVPVQEHGDLIDRDKLERDIDKYVGGEESRSRFHHWVQVQDAVIPMDKGEEK